MKRVILGFLFISILSVLAGVTGSSHDLFSSFNTGGSPQFSISMAGKKPSVCVPCHLPASTNFTIKSFSILSETTNAPSPASSMCLTCHDGTVAGDVKSDGFKASEVSQPINPINLGHSHPISVEYGYRKEMHSKTREVPGIGTIEDLLVNGKVECSSCHDVHNSDEEAYKLLRIDLGKSKLCLTCHDK